MAQLQTALTELHYVIERNRDPRTNNLPIVRHEYEGALTIILYVAMVIIGPRLMADRKAFQIKPVMIVYNLGLTTLSAYMMVELFLCQQLTSPMFGCNMTELSNSPVSVRTLNIVYLNNMSKVIEFLDSFFFIIRKKNDQLSFLHVYHHITIFFVCWLSTVFNAGGSFLMSSMINAFIHTVMYSYYFLSLFPQLRQYLWWKKYLTIMQMIQFSIIGVNSFIVALSHGCGHQKWIHQISFVYMVSLLILFGNFFLKTYKKASKVE